MLCLKEIIEDMSEKLKECKELILNSSNRKYLAEKQRK
jgi:hypothetical protein